MAPQELVRDVVRRDVISGHEGKSGAGLERVHLADGRTLVVKTIDPSADFTVAATSGPPGAEYLLWRDGVFDRLPAGVCSVLVDAWLEGDRTVLVMKDLGEGVCTWSRRLTGPETAWVMERTADLHRAFLGDVPSQVVPLERALALFAPATIRPLAETGNQLMSLALRGWELFAEQVPADVSDTVLSLLDDISPLARALERGPVTMTHGDLATVNMAFEVDTLVLLDWAMPTAAPGALDVARFVAGCASVVDLSREEVLEAYRRAAGPAYDERSTRLALLSALVWLGWNKALDAGEHPDPSIRARERADLAWWVDRARAVLENGDL
jgi:hypothetical protein